MRQEGSHPDLRYESKMLKVAPQDNTTIDFVFFGVVAVDLVFVERILWSVITTETNFFLRNLNICLLLYTRLLQGQSEGHQLLTMMINVVVGLMFSKVAKFRSLQMKDFFIIDYFTDFPYIFDLLGKSVRYVTTICGYIIYWFSLHIFLRNVGNVSKIVWNVCSVLILLTLPTFLPHHPFRVTRNVGKISKLCNHI